MDFRIFTDRNQLASIAYDSTSVASFTYDDGAREISRTLGNNLTQAQSYRNDNLLAQKSVSGVTSFAYTYNANKNKLAETDNVNTNLSQNFSYDHEERLTSWSSNGSVLNQNQSWNLSLEGAWNSTTVNGITENRTFNEVYEILTSNSNPLTHDRKGNLTQNKDSSQYTWDYNNQLSHAVNASSENASYTYDALGRRISKQAAGTLTVYINIGYQIATEYQSTDGINFTEKQSYVYATYIDDPLVLIKASGERFYYHSNGQFSISKITDEYKNVVEAYAYNAYGDVQILQNYAGLDNPYYFTGRQLDQETGLFCFRARYYDAKLGQFISRDPLTYVDGMSLYHGYFAVNGVDPSGLTFRLSVSTVEIRKRIQRLIDEICPGNFEVKTNGRIEPKDPEFCNNTCFEGTDHPTGCRCLCEAYQSERDITLSIFRVSSGGAVSETVRRIGYANRLKNKVKIELDGVYPQEVYESNKSSIPEAVVLGHELRGHILLDMPHPRDRTGYTLDDPIIQIENRLRLEMGYDLRYIDD